MWILCGNANKLGDVSRDPGKSFLFFLTGYHPEIDLVGARAQCQAKPFIFERSGAFLTTLENPRESYFHT
jgi:hypothetical protein